MTTDVTNLESMEVTLPTTLVAECGATSTADSSAISAAVGTAFQKIEAFQQANGITAAGPSRVIYTEWSPTGVHFTAAIPIAAVLPNVTNSADVSIATIPETQALRFLHRGPYRDIRTTYGRIEAWLRARAASRRRAIGRATRPCGKST